MVGESPSVLPPRIDRAKSLFSKKNIKKYKKVLTYDDDVAIIDFVSQRDTEKLLKSSVRRNAEIAQLVEHHLAKVGVASSSLVFRSILFVSLM